MREEILEQALVEDLEVWDLEHPCQPSDNDVQALLLTIQIFVEQDKQPDLMLRHELCTVVIENFKELLSQIFSYDCLFAFAFFSVLLDLLRHLYEVVCVAQLPFLFCKGKSHPHEVLIKWPVRCV